MVLLGKHELIMSFAEPADFFPLSFFKDGSTVEESVFCPPGSVSVDLGVGVLTFGRGCSWSPEKYLTAHVVQFGGSTVFVFFSFRCFQLG